MIKFNLNPHLFLNKVIFFFLVSMLFVLKNLWYKIAPFDLIPFTALRWKSTTQVEDDNGLAGRVVSSANR